MSNKNNDIDAFDALFDESNSDNIVLYNKYDEKIEFVQIATIPFEDSSYAILKPVEDIEGVEDNEAFVFEIISDDNGSRLELVMDEKIIGGVFEIYNQLFDKSK